MRGHSLPLAVLVVTSFVLAGCVGEDTPETGGTATGPSEAPETAAPATPTASTGTIEGKVLLVSLDPIAGAALVLTFNGDVIADTIADKQGRFTFNDLEPGAYRVQATASCCHAGVKLVGVEAGKAAPADFLLEEVPSVQPFKSEWQWSGFIGCGAGAEQGNYALCSITDGTPAEDPNGVYNHKFNLSEGIKTFSGALVWDAVVDGAVGNDLNFRFETDLCAGIPCYYRYIDLDGPSPLIGTVSNHHFTTNEHNWDNITGERAVQFRIVPGGNPGVTVQQAFTVYVTEFFHEAGPDDHNPIPDQ